MKLSYETQGANTYLVYTVPQDVQLDMISVGMLANNHIPGLAQTIFSQVDSTKYIKYNVSAKVPSEQMFMTPISKRRFLGVINGIISAVLSAEEYMLEADTLLFDLGYMFSDIMTGETILICIPTEEQKDSPVDLKEFIKKIMYNTSFDQNENCDYIAKIINYLNGSVSLVLPDFQEFLRSLGSEQAKPQNQQPAPQPQFQPQPQPVNMETPQAPMPQNQMNMGQVNPVPQAPQAVRSAPQQMGQSFAVPQQPAGSAVPAAPPAAAGADDKQMSFMYLLRHYSKENAAAYKAQQEQSKEAKKAASPKPAAKKEDKRAAKKAAKKETMQAPAAGFMVPGMENSNPAPSPAPAPAAAGAVQRPAAPPAPVQRPVAQAPVQQPAPTPAPVQYPPMAQLPVQQQQPSMPQNVFEETAYLSPGGDETVILGAGAQQAVMPYLVRKRNNERIPLNKEFFRLGRDVDFNDYAILDNRYVGHSHCHLVQQDGEYFIVDDNSKNHTKVNGEVITPGQLVKLSHGYVISVADEEFEFKLY